MYFRFPWKVTSESTTVRSLFSSGLGWLLNRAIFLMTRSASANLSWDTSHRKLSGTILKKRTLCQGIKKFQVGIQLCLSNYLKIKYLNCFKHRCIKNHILHYKTIPLNYYLAICFLISDVKWQYPVTPNFRNIWFPASLSKTQGRGVAIPLVHVWSKF